MNDYKKDAEEALAHCAATNQQGKDPVGYAHAAATLYLAEQQRIANLIAVATWNDQAFQEGGRLPSDREVDRSEQRARIDAMFHEAHEGLGLS